MIRTPLFKYRWQIIGASAVVLYILATLFAVQHRVFAWESVLFQSINQLPNFGIVMQIITTLGSVWAVTASVIIAFSFKLYHLAWRLAAVFGATYFIVALSKHFVGRGRPTAFWTDVHLRATETSMGFPSGHAMVSMVLACLLWAYIPRTLRWILPFGVLLVCFSRMYLGVHLPLDIVGGLLISLAAVAAYHSLPQKLAQFLRLR